MLAAQVWNPRLHEKSQSGFPDLDATQKKRFGEKDKKQKQKDFWEFITASQQRGGGTTGNKFSERLCQGIRQALLEEDSCDLHMCIYIYLQHVDLHAYTMHTYKCSCSAGKMLGQQASATHLLHFYFLFLVWSWRSKPGLEYARTLYQPSLKSSSATTINSQQTTHQHNPICMSTSC